VIDNNKRISTPVNYIPLIEPPRWALGTERGTTAYSLRALPAEGGVAAGGGGVAEGTNDSPQTAQNAAYG